MRLEQIPKRAPKAVIAALLAMAALLALPAPAQAAPGDASARGLVVALDAEVLGIPVIDATATVGSADAPPGGGTETFTLLSIGLPGAIGVTANGTVEEVTATRGPTESSAASSVTGLGLSLLGITVLDASAITASVTCPAVGAQTAETTLADLALFGSAVTLDANTPAVTASAAVAIPGVVGASLDASLTRIEVATADGATAVAITLSATITGTIGIVPIVLPVGTVIVAEATCERPLASAAPTAATIIPEEGPQSGGQTVTITGTDFVPGDTTVTFDGVPATDIVVDPDGTSLTAVTPPGAPGTVDVVVTTPGGSSAPLAYTYLADGSDAVVTGLAPDTGPTSGGTTVTITGSGFTGATGVTFDGTPGTDLTVDPAGTTITIVTPPGPAGPADVVITFPTGTAAAGTFTYVAPTIASIVPDEGPASGGTTVTITGSGFTGATEVTFDGTPGTDLTVSPDGTSLTVVTPPGAPGTVDVVVAIPGQDAVAPDGFTYLAAPTAATIAPDEGPQSGGQTVTITGTGFVPGDTTVTFDGVPATDVVVDPSGTSLTAVTPPGTPGPADVVVATTGGPAAALAYTYLADGSDAVVTGLAPDTGPTSGGTTVTITGSGFTGATGVTFDGVPGTDLTVSPDGTSLTVVTPPGTPGAADVVITFPAGTAAAGTFTYADVTPPPTDPPAGTPAGPPTGPAPPGVAGAGADPTGDRQAPGAPSGRPGDGSAGRGPSGAGGLASTGSPLASLSLAALGLLLGGTLVLLDRRRGHRSGASAD